MTPEGDKRDTYYGGWTLTAKTLMLKVPLNKYTTAELSRQSCRCVREELGYDRAIAHFYMLTDRRWEVIPQDKVNDSWLKNTISQLGDMILDMKVGLATLSDSREKREDADSEEESGGGEDNDSEEEAQFFFFYSHLTPHSPTGMAGGSPRLTNTCAPTITAAS